MTTGEEGPRPRTYALAVAAVAVVALVATVLWLVNTQRIFAGTNSVAPRAIVAGLGPGQRLCVDGVEVPGNTHAVRIRVQTTQPSVRLRLALAGNGTRQTSGATVSGPQIVNTDFAIAPPGRDLQGSVCLTAGKTIGLAGEPGTVPDSTVSVNGTPVGASVALWYLRGSSRSVAAALPDAPPRAALFRAGWVGPWTYVLLIFLVIVLWAAGLRRLWRSL